MLATYIATEYGRVGYPTLIQKGRFPTVTNAFHEKAGDSQGDFVFTPRQQNLWADSGSGSRPSV
jgi:hypothetical protein